MSTEQSGTHPEHHRVDDARTRLLAAARSRFADQGLHATTLRAIAADAGVDVALISHYFGSKSGLFTAAMELPELATSVVTDALSEDPARRGEVLTRDFLRLWEDPETADAMRVVCLAALTEPDARVALRGVMAGDLQSPALRALSDDQITSLSTAMSYLLGVATCRCLVRTPVLATLELEELVERVAPAVQLQLEDMARRRPRDPEAGEWSPESHRIR